MSTISLPRPIAPVNAPWRPETEITWELALRYRGWGWRVLPLYDKRPARNERGRCLRWEHHKHSGCSIDRLRSEWDSATLVDGVGIISGPVSGIAVADFDDGEAYRRWAEAYPFIAAICPTVRTGRGYHVYHRPTGEAYFKFDGGDYLSHRNRYFKGPLSRHTSTGLLYEWVGAPPEGPDSFPVLGPSDFGFRPPAPPRREKTPPPQRPAYPPAQSPPREVIEWRAVRMCVPTREGERNDKLWELARRAKFAPGADVWAMFESWWEMSEENVGTKEVEESRSDFARMLKLAVRPHGEGFREAATAVVNGALPEQVGPYTDLPTRKLAALCQALQAHAGPGKSFPLSVRLAAELCGFSSWRTAARRIACLSKLGILERVKQGTKLLAAEYQKCSPPIPPLCCKSCVPPSETQTPCPVLTVVFRAGGWTRGLRELAREAGVSVRQAASALERAVADGKLTRTDGKGCRPAVYGVPAATVGAPAESQPAPIPSAEGPSALPCPAPQPIGETPAPPAAPTPVPVPLSARKLGPTRMEVLRSLPPIPPRQAPTGSPLDLLEQLVRSHPNGVYLIGGSEVCPFEETIAERVGTTAENVGPLAAELVRRGLIKRTFEAPEAEIPGAWEQYCPT